MSLENTKSPFDDESNVLSTADRCLLDAIRGRQSEAWALFVGRYHGRLLAFATARLGQHADAEDVIQDTFMSFIKAIDSYRGQASLETYLFTILRNKIIDRYRSAQARSISLIQDVYSSSGNNSETNAISQLSLHAPSVSWCVSRNEQQQIQQDALTRALRRLLKGFKDSLNFRNLKIVELIFYCNISGADTARFLNMESETVRVFKHRCLKKVREDVASLDISMDSQFANFENLLTEIWESQRLSCPKRSTIGAFLLEKLEPEWFDYIDFHLTTLGCHFCRANLKDLKHQRKTDEEQLFKKQILSSTIGFFTAS